MSTKYGGRNSMLNTHLINCLLCDHSSGNCPNCGSPYDRPMLPVTNLRQTVLPKEQSVVKPGGLETISLETMNFLRPHNMPIFTGRPGSLQTQTVNMGFDLRPIPPTLFSEDEKPTGLQEILHLVSIQKYINKLGFLREGESKIQIDTTKSIRYQMETAKEIIKAGQPIKSSHAVVLGIYFTNCTPNVERFTITFKYNHKGKEYTYVVLGITFSGFAIIGISRHAVLHKLNRPAGFRRMSDLISAFKSSYKKLGQVLIEVKISEIIPHDPRSLKRIDWSHYTLGSKALDDSSALNKLEEHLQGAIQHKYMLRIFHEHQATKSKSRTAVSKTNSTITADLSY